MMKSENNPVVLNKTKSNKFSDHIKVKKLKRTLNKRFNSKSYETISLSKKEDLKKNIITFIHSSGFIPSDTNANIKINGNNNSNTNNNNNTNNKGHLSSTTNGILEKGDKMRGTNPTYHKENIKARRLSLPSPEILKDLQNHRNKILSSTSSTLESFKKLYSTSSPTSPSPSPSSTISSDKSLVHAKTTTSTESTSPMTENNVKVKYRDIPTTKPTIKNIKTMKLISKSLSQKSSPKSVPKSKSKIKPKSKLSQSVTLPVSPILDSNSSGSEPSAPSLDEMYLEEVKDPKKYMQYKDLVQSESQLESKSLLNKTNNNTIDTATLTTSSSPVKQNLSDPQTLSSSLIQNFTKSIPQNPFEPPFTTLSTIMTALATTTSSFSEKSSSKLPKPSSLTFYTHMTNGYGSVDPVDTIPPKIQNQNRYQPDSSIEKTVPCMDSRLYARRDSLDFYFDQLSLPSKSSTSISCSPNSSLISSPSSSFINLSSSCSEDSTTTPSSSIRLMSEPQPIDYDKFSIFNQVIRENFTLRNNLEDKVEETKFQMMIAITQIGLIKEQLDILNFL